MYAFLVRHAHAGDRTSDRHDIYRPLSDEGHGRADELAAMLGEQSEVGPVDRLLASTATRCVQTLEPLGRALGVSVEECAELWEDATADEALQLIESAIASSPGGHLAACSHGNIIPGIIDRLAERGVEPRGRGCEKGSIWVLEWADGRWVSARYLKKAAVALA